MSRRRGSAMALKVSEVVEARGMSTLYSYMEYVNPDDRTADRRSEFWLRPWNQWSRAPAELKRETPGIPEHHQA